MPREGGFCGYRNIQMLVSYLVKTQAQAKAKAKENGNGDRNGPEYFKEGVPSILQLQDLIERAWDLGFNSTGRTETGGIKGTRKFIGTPEVSGREKNSCTPEKY